MNAFIELHSFITAAELHSFSAAARQLGLTPSTVSKHVRKLEDELRIQLFSRSTRKIVLTDQGQHFLELCKQPTMDLLDASRTIAETTLEPSGLLRVSCATDYGRVKIVPLLGQFMQKYPNIQCELILTDSISDLVGEHFDISIRVGSQLADSAFICRKLNNFALTTCASPQYLKQYGTPKTIDDMTAHRCITIKLPKTGKILPWEFFKAGKKLLFTPPSFIATNDPDALKIMALNHTGIIQTGSYSVDDDIEKGRLIPLFTANSAKHWDAYAIYPSKQNLGLKVRAFVDFLLAKM